MNKILVIIPAYNEESSIAEVVNKVKAASKDFDYIVINDCSTDNTKEVLEKQNIPYLDLPINLGIGGTMQAGYIYAKVNNYNFAIQVDGDGQHIPTEIKKLVNEQKASGSNLVIGSRFLSNRNDYNQSYFRMLGIKIFEIVAFVLIGQKISDATSGFRLVDKKVIELYSNYYPSDYPEPEVLIYLKKNGLKLSEVQVTMNNRETGTSSITPLKSVYYMIKVTSSMLIQKIRSKGV